MMSSLEDSDFGDGQAKAHRSSPYPSTKGVRTTQIGQGAFDLCDAKKNLKRAKDRTHARVERRDV